MGAYTHSQEMFFHLSHRYVEAENEVCQGLHKVVRKCENYVYRYINVNETPAMKPPMYLFNRPDWLK